MATTCPLCGGVEEATRVTFTATLDGNLLTIEEVPALVCRQCGEETFSAETMKRIEALVGIPAQTSPHGRSPRLRSGRSIAASDLIGHATPPLSLSSPAICAPIRPFSD